MYLKFEVNTTTNKLSFKIIFSFRQIQFNNLILQLFIIFEIYVFARRNASCFL